MVKNFDRAITTAQLSRRIGVAEITIRKWRMNNKGPKWHKYDNGTVRYYMSDVLQWEKHGKRKG